MITRAEPESETARPRFRPVECNHLRQIAGVLAAVVSAVAVFVAAGALGVEVSVPEPPSMEMAPLIAPRVALVAALSSIGAVVLARVLSKRVEQPRKAWFTVAWAVLVASFIPSFILDEAVGAKVALSLMHVAVALPLMLLVAPEKSS